MIKLSRDLDAFLADLNDLQNKALEIARGHLGSSFNLNRSNGFKEWKQLQSELEKYLNDLEDESTSQVILERKLKEGSNFRIEDTEEFEEWNKLQNEIEKYLKDLDKTVRQVILDRKLSDGRKFRIENTDEFREWKAKKES